MRFYKLIALYVASMMLLVVASWLNLHLLYIMATALTSIIFVAYIIARISLSDLSAIRLMPLQATENEEVHVRLTLSSGPFRWHPWVIVIDGLPAEMHAELVSEPPVVSLIGREPASVDYAFRSRMYGRFKVRSLQVQVADPIGLFTVFRDVATAPSEIVIYPAAEPLPAASSFEQGMRGMHQIDLGRSRGFGMEPHTVREYVPGDQLKRIHWRSSARRGRLHVVEYESGHVSEVVIAVDLAREAEFGPRPFTSTCQMVRNACHLAREGIDSGASVRILGQSILGEVSEPGRSEGHWLSILEAFADSNTESGWSLADMLRHEMEHLPYNSTLFVLTTLGDPQLLDTLEALGAKNVVSTVLLYEPAQFGDATRPIKHEFPQCTDPKFLNGLERLGVQHMFVPRS